MYIIFHRIAGVLLPGGSFHLLHVPGWVLLPGILVHHLRVPRRPVQPGHCEVILPRVPRGTLAALLPCSQIGLHAFDALASLHSPTPHAFSHSIISQGYYCPYAASAYYACPAGYYCPYASGGITACPTGKYSAASRFTLCLALFFF